MTTPKIYPINFDLIISVPIIGDRSIALLPPPKGFVYKEVLFDKYLFNPNMRNYNGHVLLDYAHGLFDDPEKILVLEHQSNYTLEFDKPITPELFGFSYEDETLITQKLASVRKELIESLRTYFALLHIYKEGDLAYKGIFVRYAYKNNFICRHVNHFDAITLNQKPMTFSTNEIADATNFISTHDVAFNMVKSVIISDLICSYHCFYDSTNYKNMFTIFEVLLSIGEFDSDVLAKKIATLINTNDKDINATYKRFKKLYSIRNNAVHRGETAPITRDLLDELRNMVRDVIKAYFSHIEKYIKYNKSATFTQAKKNCIKHLNVKIKAKKKWPVIKTKKST